MKEKAMTVKEARKSRDPKIRGLIGGVINKLNASFSTTSAAINLIPKQLPIPKKNPQLKDYSLATCLEDFFSEYFSKDDSSGAFEYLSKSLIRLKKEGHIFSKEEVFKAIERSRKFNETQPRSKDGIYDELGILREKNPSVKGGRKVRRGAK